MIYPSEFFLLRLECWCVSHTGSPAASPFLSRTSPPTYSLGAHRPLRSILPAGLPPSLPFPSRRHQSDGNEIAHTRLRASTRDLRASPKPASKSTIEEDLKKLIDLESPTPESQKNFKVQGRARGRWQSGRPDGKGPLAAGAPSWLTAPLPWSPPSHCHPLVLKTGSHWGLLSLPPHLLVCL